MVEYDMQLHAARGTYSGMGWASLKTDSRFAKHFQPPTKTWKLEDFSINNVSNRDTGPSEQGSTRASFNHW